METTEKIVESYCRYVKQWFTIPNIKCKGQYEVDLLAVDTSSSKELRRYHVECGVSISGSYSKLTDKPFSTEHLKIRVKQAGQRRTLGYFIERKFELPQVLSEIRKYGFVPGNYERIIVTWGQRLKRKRWQPSVMSSYGTSGKCYWRLRMPTKIKAPTSQMIPLEQSSSSPWPPMGAGPSRPNNPPQATRLSGHRVLNHHAGRAPERKR